MKPAWLLDSFGLSGGCALGILLPIPFRLIFERRLVNEACIDFDRFFMFILRTFFRAHS